MKKAIFIFALLLALTVAVSAQSYTVQEVTGRVQKESGSNRINVTSGETLTDETIIHTGVGASLMLRNGDDTFAVTAAKSGKLSELVIPAAGVRVRGNALRADTTEVTRTTGQLSTAAGRASDLAADDNVAAE
ncbi:MAG: hypothetical protein LBU66_01340 [Treponema sp.]|jgi:hypothetical protein|nr:hypothetical protein [Treponema sp.]